MEDNSSQEDTGQDTERSVIDNERTDIEAPPSDDNFDKKHRYSVWIIIEMVFGAVFFMFLCPIFQNVYWTAYVYECFGYSIRLGILKWTIAICYGINFYFLFDYIDGPVVGVFAVIFFIIYTRILLWMRKAFGK